MKNNPDSAAAESWRNPKPNPLRDSLSPDPPESGLVALIPYWSNYVRTLLLKDQNISGLDVLLFSTSILRDGFHATKLRECLPHFVNESGEKRGSGAEAGSLSREMGTPK